MKMFTLDENVNYQLLFTKRNVLFWQSVTNTGESKI